MKRNVKSMVIGALALTGAMVASTDGQAMPVQPLGSTASHASDIEHVYWRGGYGYRRGFFRGWLRLARRLRLPGLWLWVPSLRIRVRLASSVLRIRLSPLVTRIAARCWARRRAALLW